ncbi:MAG TPA: cytidine deaminase [Candidatus Angelobacter sp.]
MANPTSEIIESLMATAAAAAEKAYAPYSHFRVGAALLFDDGTVTGGCNVENISYGLTICAERTALCRAIAEHGAHRQIVAIAVTNLNDAASPPCGACRQMLSEFAAPDAIVYFPHDRGATSVPFKDLLPYTFHSWKKEDDARR